MTWLMAGFGVYLLIGSVFALMFSRWLKRIDCWPEDELREHRGILYAGLSLIERIGLPVALSICTLLWPLIVVAAHKDSK